MATGAFWNTTDDPLKPWGYFDPDDVINIPFDFSAWLADQGTTYVSHVQSGDAKLTVTSVSANSGIVILQAKRAVGQTLNEGEKYGVTCQITAADGQKKSRTLYLKAKEL